MCDATCIWFSLECSDLSWKSEAMQIYHSDFYREATTQENPCLVTALATFLHNRHIPSPRSLQHPCEPNSVTLKTEVTQ